MEIFTPKVKLLFSTLSLSLSLASFSLQACSTKDEKEVFEDCHSNRCPFYVVAPQVGNEEEVLSSLLSPAVLASQPAEEDKSRKGKRKRNNAKEEDEEEQIAFEDVSFSVDLPDEVLLRIFSFLNQKDIPFITGVSQRWRNLMDDNSLWKGYAKKAGLIIDAKSPSQDRNYKALIRDHCTPSFTALGTLNGGTDSWARGVSLDGSVIIGSAKDGAAQDKCRAFRWTVEGGMQSLGALNGGTNSYAYGVSPDGLTVVGYADDGLAQNQERAFRWTQEEGMQSLGTFNSGRESCAWDVSSNGSVIVGDAEDGAAQNNPRAFRWTQKEGMQSLGTLNGGTESCAWGVSSDGSVIVGDAEDGAAQNNPRAFRWTREEGMQSLGTLNGGTESCAWDVSADGSVIVGQTADGAARNQERAFQWTHETGMKLVEKLLADKKIFPGWRLTSVTAITPSGTVLVGEGEYTVQLEDGEAISHVRAWRAVIPRGNLF